MSETIGVLRSELSLSLQNLLSRVIDNNKGKESYYILVTASSPEEKTIETRVALLSRRPPKMLDTLCYFVDNKRGSIKRMWALPLDIPVPDALLSDNGVEEVYISGQDVPIIFK